jgi:RND family efflux transporter MFP subunit
MNKWIGILVVAGLAGGGFYAWRNYGQPGQTAAAPARATTAPAELRDISFVVNAAGEITPAEQVSVRPEINGKIDTLPVDIGDRVKKGALLFKLDDIQLQQQRAANVTDIDKAKLELQKAQRDLQRAEKLLAGKLISQELYDDTKTSADLAANALERAQRDLAITDESLSKTQVRAPFDCTVLTRPVSIGQAVSGSGGYNSGSEVLTIADLNAMIINAQVNQADVPRLKVGQTVEVAVEAVAGLRINGTVERVSPQATIKNNIKGFAARILLKDVDARVRPGMTANVKIPVASADNVTTVPLSAVFTEKNPTSSQMERFVYVQKADGFEKRPVKVGISDYFYAEIQEGLSAGDVVSLELPKDEAKRPVPGGPAGADTNKGNLKAAGPRGSKAANGTGTANAGTNKTVAATVRMTGLANLGA